MTDYEIIKLFIAQGEALMRFKCAVREESIVGDLAVKRTQDSEIWKQWSRARQRCQNAHRRLEAISNKIKDYQNNNKNNT